jgi:hypothetical protein
MISTPDPKLFMLLLGCKPPGRHTEQHDIFFGIANTLKELVPALHQFWPEAKKNIHLDAWRAVTSVQQYTIRPRLKADHAVSNNKLKLFFLNLGGYRKNEFEEYHYKLLVVAENIEEAKAQAKQELFYKETGFKGASAHVDDQYGIDVDEAYSVEEILPESISSLYHLEITEKEAPADVIELGYLPLWKIN